MKLSRSSIGLLAAGILTGAVAIAQTTAPQQSDPTTPAAGAGANAQTTPPQGQAGASATTPVGQAGASASTPQTSTPPASQSKSSEPQSSSPQGTTTYTTTTQTTVPQSSQPNGTSQPGTAGSTAYPSGQPASSVPGAVPPTGQPETLIDPGRIYNDKQPTSWVGKPIVLQNVMIQDTNDSGNFWVGSDGHHRLLIVKQDNNPNLKAMRFHKGDVVTISGTVQPASKYMARETTAGSGDMHDAEKSSGVFLLADNVTIGSSTHK